MTDFTSARAAIEKLYSCHEAHRAACEARYVAALPDYQRMIEFFAGVEEKRGPECATRLREDVCSALRQRKKGA